MQEAAANPRFRSVAQATGPLLCGLLILFGPAELTPEARRTLGIAAWMVTWWITECVPIITTSLLPLVLFPVLRVSSTRDAAPWAWWMDVRSRWETRR